jgi:DNA-binding transcriptional ArsR family regulator
VSKEVLRRMFQRLGQTLKALPEERRRQVLESLGEGFEDSGSGYGIGEEDPAPDFYFSVARSLAEGYTDAEFLELLAGILSMERKGGKRLLQAFRVIAAGRDIEGSLVPLLETWSTEGHHAKEYYAGKTWLAVERLLLDRSEGAYLGTDHSQFLESLSGAPGGPDRGREQDLQLGPALAPFLEPDAVRRKGIAVLLDLLSRGWQDGEYRDLLGAVEEVIPGLIEGREFALLDRVLDAVAAAGEPGSEVRRQAVPKTLAAADFRRIAGICLAGPEAARQSGEGLALLVKHGPRSADDLLDRLLEEPDKGMRRILLSLLVRIGEPAVPFILERLRDLPWYFLRNLCLLLGEIGVPETVPGLVRMMSHKEVRVRREAIQALGKLRAADPDAISALGKILQTESLFHSPKEDPIRIDAASALSRIGGAEALSYLHRGKESRRAVVREHCEALLRTKGKE